MCTQRINDVPKVAWARDETAAELSYPSRVLNALIMYNDTCVRRPEVTVTAAVLNEVLMRHIGPPNMLLGESTNSIPRTFEV